MSIPAVGLTNPKTTTPMSFQSIKAEADAIGAKINQIIQRIRTATLAELHAVEDHLGLVHPSVENFNDFDNRLGTIVERLHHVEPAQLDQAHDLLISEGIPENVVPFTPEVNETTQAPADTTVENGAASSGASVEATNPDQPVS